MKKLLLHVCCAPCACSVLERLGNDYEITIYFYNPNIINVDEYEKRYNELLRLVKEMNFNFLVIKEKFDSKKFYKYIEGFEKEPEKGLRCGLCYELRMSKSAKKAKELGIDMFTTTLSVSPHKVYDYIRNIGLKLEEKYNTKFLDIDFKKQDGYKRSVELSKIYNLYRQNFCGCIYSKKD